MNKTVIKALLLSSVLTYSFKAADGGWGRRPADDDMSVMTGLTAKTGSTFASSTFNLGQEEWESASSSPILGAAVSLDKLCKDFDKLVLQGKKNSIALKALSRAADRGDKIAENLLGHVHFKSMHYKDEERAERRVGESLDALVDQAGEPGAEEGDIGAQLCLGLCHLWGHGTDEDEEEAQGVVRAVSSLASVFGSACAASVGWR